MLLLATNRIALLKCLPHGAVVAEVGVAKGEFSRNIFTIARPRELHLVDPWRHFDDPQYLADRDNTSDTEGERRFRAVSKLFAKIASVKVHRQTALEAAGSFPDRYFDWIYLDAQHHYAAVKADLEALDKKVKSTGFIVGHDYANHPAAQKKNFGVVKAVNEFVRSHGYQFMCLTEELYPSYVLAKRSGPQIATLLRDLAATFRVKAEIGHPENKKFSQAIIGSWENQQTIFSFE